jgi:teichuronic acid biosynthesis glycosyltransferase TuaG
MDENGEAGSVIPCPRHVTYTQLLKQNVIGCLTVMLDKEKIGTAKMENIRSRQDYVLWLTLLKNGHQAYGLQEVLSKYRLGHNSLSKNKFQMAKQNWRVYREIEKLDVFKSSWYFLHYMYFKLNKYKLITKQGNMGY